MIGKISINGQIGSVGLAQGVELIDVIQQVKAQPLATSFDVYINSEGGVVDVGFDIYNYLKNLGKPVNTIGSGIVASIATVIFMAGQTRTLKGNTQFMVHLPRTNPNSFINSEEAEQLTDHIKKTEKTMIDFYAGFTDIDSDSLKSLLKNETWLTPEQAKTFGFITEHQTELKAVAYFEHNSKTDKQMSTMTAEDKSWIEKKFEDIASLFKSKTVALILQDSNGVEVNFPDLADDATPAIGDVATVEGQPAEGVFVMPQLGNASVTFVAGAITEIVEAEAEGDEDEEMAKLKAENEQLKSELAEIASAKEAEVAKAEKQLKKIEAEFIAFKGEIVAKLDIDEKKEPKKKEPKTVNLAQERLNKLKNRK